MDKFKWRSMARIVAYVDLILPCITLVVILVIFEAVRRTRTSTEYSRSFDYTGLPWIVWVIVIFLILGMYALSLWATTMLLYATKVGDDPIMALEKAKYWLTINTIFLAAAIVTQIAIHQFWELMFPFVLRGTFIYIVREFVKEVKSSCFPTTSLV